MALSKPVKASEIQDQAQDRKIQPSLNHEAMWICLLTEIGVPTVETDVMITKDLCSITQAMVGPKEVLVFQADRALHASAEPDSLWRSISL